MPVAATDAPRRTGRRVPLLLLKIVLAVVILVTGLELGLRFLKTRHQGIRALLYMPEAEENYDDVDTLPQLLERSMLGFVPFTNYSGYVLNSKSLRTEEYAEQKPAGVERIVVLGDSFAFCSGGMPYSDHWVTLLESNLHERTGGAVEVINLSVPAVGPRFERRMWEIEGANLGADRVVLALFVGNDLTTEQGAVAMGSLPPGLLPRVKYESHLLRALRNLQKMGDAEAEVKEERAQLPTHDRGGWEIQGYRDNFDDTRPVFAADAYVGIETHAMHFHGKEWQERLGHLIDDVCGTIGKLRDQVRDAGGELTVLLIPAAFQVQEDVRQSVLQRTGRAAETYDLDFAQARLVDFCSREGIDCLDVLAPFRDAARDKSLYRLRDTHWNKEGNRLAARLLADHLATKR